MAPEPRDAATPGTAELRRALSTPMLVLYGLGTTVGAGIYALTGEIAGLAGTWTPAAFALAAAVAAFTALSFGELAARHPRSAGEAAYLRAGFGSPHLATLGGLLVALAGTISAAAMTRAALGYLGVGAWTGVGATALVLAMASVVAWGIRESVGLAALLTVLEVGGVVLVTGFAGIHVALEGPAVATAAGSAVGPGATGSAAGILSGAVLGFYAFLGFEDMVNVAEEVVEPRRMLLRAIVMTLGVTALLYVALAAVAVQVVAPAELAASGAPLTLLYARAAGPFPQLISGIAVAGILNGVLIQMIMASRVLYGLADQGALPRGIGRVHPRTRTPLRATALVAVGVLILALLLPLEPLARATSWITLAMFCAVNLALLRMKRRDDAAPDGPRVPAAVPRVGALLCAGMLVSELLL